MRAPLAVLVVLALCACPSEGGLDAGPGAGGDAGPGGPGGQGGPVDVGCALDEECGPGLICDRTTGACVAGFDCSQNPGICGLCGDPAVDCGFGAQPAYCDEGAGVCRRSKAQCDPCVEDAECAAAATGLDSRCVDGFCATGCGACPPGYLCQDGGCVPAPNAGSCEGAVSCRDGEACPDGQTCSELGVCLRLCAGDDDCEAGRICFLEPGPLQRQCIDACPLGTTNGAGEVCHADGRFGPACPTPDQTTGCPAGTVCDDAGVCVLTGCQGDQDCPLVRTYCDTGTGACVEGCNDAADCGAFEECAAGQCVAGGCRNKDSSCELGQWCCGADLYAEQTCPAPVEQGACFFAPDPWCRPCEDNDDCADIDVLGFASYCYELQRQDEQGNTVSLGKFCSVGCNGNADCPRGIQCRTDLPTDQDGVTTQGCLDALCPALVDVR